METLTELRDDTKIKKKNKDLKMQKNIFNVVFEKTIKNSEGLNDEIKSMDKYLDDTGLLRCSKCHGQLETIIKDEYTAELPKGYLKVNCVCKCIKEEEERRKHISIVRELKKMAFKDPEYAEMTFEKDKYPNLSASKTAREYVKNWDEMYEENIGIIFQGDCGVGKTFYSTCIANALLEKEITVYETNLPDLICDITKNFGEKKDEILTKVSKVSLLIIDDIGTERNTEFNLEKYFEIIDTRYRSNKPLILTTNLTDEKLNTTDQKYRRIYDRILYMTFPVKIECGNSRMDLKALRRKTFAKISASN